MDVRIASVLLTPQVAVAAQQERRDVIFLHGVIVFVLLFRMRLMVRD